MKKIKISFEYKAFPIWVYNEVGELLANDSPKELLENKSIDDELVSLQECYDKLFVDDGIEFKFNGFKSIILEQEFKKRVDNVITEIKALVGKNYSIEKSNRI